MHNYIHKYIPGICFVQSEKHAYLQSQSYTKSKNLTCYKNSIIILKNSLVRYTYYIHKYIPGICFVQSENMHTSHIQNSKKIDML